MTIFLHNRVKETSITSGSGTVTLAGAATGFQAFSNVLSSGQKTFYTIENSPRWEVGIGTYGSDSLSRDTVLSSSSGGSKISLSGNSNIFIAYPSEKSVYKDENDQVVAGSSGVILATGSPSSTSNTLYNIGGSLYFNGSAIGGLTYTAGTGLVLDGAEFNVTDPVIQSGDNISLLNNDAGYLTSESDTLQTVTDRGSNTTNSITTSGNITATTGIFDILDLTLIANGDQPAHSEGVVFYDSENHTLSLYNDEADVALQLGQEEFLRVRNNSGGTIYNGSGVRITGAHGASAPTVVPAIATTEQKAQVVGLATHDIENNSFGYVTTYGIVRDVNTEGFSAGDELFLDASTSGNLTNVSPIIPDYKVRVGHVIRSHTNGSILVTVGSAKLGGGDVKVVNGSINLSGVPYYTEIANTNAGGLSSNSAFLYDSGNNQLQLGSGVQLLNAVPGNTTNVLYNDGGTLKFNGSAVDTDTTYTAGTGLSLAGTEFNIDETVIQSGDNVSFLSNDAGYLTAHPVISAASSSDNSGRTYIQDIILDSNGHVTGITTATETVTDTDTTYTAGSGLSLNGAVFDVNIENTIQTTAPESVTTTANRTYSVQTDVSDNLVVNVPWSGGGGGSTSPGGADTYVQFNNSGSFDGSSDLTWNGSSLQVGSGVGVYPLDVFGNTAGWSARFENSVQAAAFSAQTFRELTDTARIRMISTDIDINQGGNDVNIRMRTNTNSAAFLMDAGNETLDIGVGTTFTADASTTVPAIIQGAAAQSANLQEWQDATGSGLAHVDSEGNIYSSGYVQADRFYLGTSNDLDISSLPYLLNSATNDNGVWEFHNCATMHMTKDSRYLDIYPKTGQIAAMQDGQIGFKSAFTKGAALNAYIYRAAADTLGVHDHLAVDGTITATGITASGSITVTSGITIPSLTPASTTNTLYNVGGILYFNGSGVNSDSDTTYTAGTGITLNGTTFDANVNATTQTTAPESVTSTASRTYAVQVDASDNLVVNVPWSGSGGDITAVNAGSGLSGGGVTGDVTLNALTATTAASGITILTNTINSDQDKALTPKAVNDAGYLTAHPNISAASSSDNSGRTYIQDIILDSNGHVTGIATATETVTDTTYTAGTGLSLDGTEFNIDETVIQSGDNVSLLSNDAGYLTAHPAISAASSSDNSGRTYIQDIILDSNGHVTGIATATETVTDTTYTAGTGLSLDGTEFNIDATVIQSGDNISLLNNDSGYLTAESDTLETVIGRGSVATSNFTTSGDIIVAGGFATESTSRGIISNINEGTGGSTNTYVYVTHANSSSQSRVGASNSTGSETVSVYLSNSAPEGGLHILGENVISKRNTGALKFNPSYQDMDFVFYPDAGSTNPIFFMDSVEEKSIFGGGNADLDGQLGVKILTATDAGITVQGAAAQSANLQEWKNSSGINLAHVDAVGNVETSGYVRASSGVLLDEGTPASTTNTLYNVGGVLHFNGSGVNGGGGGSFNNFTLTADGGSNQTIADGNTLDIAGGSGITTAVGATDTVTVNLDAAQTTITSVYNASLKMGRDSQNLIDFATTDNKIILRANNVDQVSLIDNVFGPEADSDVDLGTTAKRWKDAYVDSLTTTGDVTCGGEVNTAKVSYTDGDDAITIADGGAVTFAKSINQAPNTATDGGIVDIDCSTSNYHEILMNADATRINFTNVTAGQRVIVRFQQHSSHIDLNSSEGFNDVDVNGSNATIKWAGGVVPTLTESNNAVDVYGFIFESTVTNVMAFIIGQNIS